MNVHSCGVAGCLSPPRWERVSQADADLHEYLCGNHWKMLHAHNWIAAAAYRPVSTVPSLVLTDNNPLDTTSTTSDNG
jgi:hypothetical protein